LLGTGAGESSIEGEDCIQTILQIFKCGASGQVEPIFRIFAEQLVGKFWSTRAWQGHDWLCVISLEFSPLGGFIWGTISE
jgi:hypothetical protein